MQKSEIISKKEACRLLREITKIPARTLSRTLKKSSIQKQLSDNNINIKMFESKRFTNS